MPEARVTVDGEQYSIEVKDIDGSDRMSLALKAPDSLTEEVEDVDNPDDIDIEVTEELVEYFSDVLVMVTEFTRDEVRPLSVKERVRLGSEVFNVAFGDTGSDTGNKRVKRVRLTEEFIECLFRGESAVVAGMPDDATLENFEYDPSRNVLQFVFESSEWEPIAEAETIPVFDIYAAQIGSI